MKLYIVNDGWRFWYLHIQHQLILLQFHLINGIVPQRASFKLKKIKCDIYVAIFSKMRIVCKWQIRFGEQRKKLNPTEYGTFYAPYSTERCAVFDRIYYTCDIYMYVPWHYTVWHSFIVLFCFVLLRFIYSKDHQLYFSKEVLIVNIYIEKCIWVLKQVVLIVQGWP